MQPGGHIFWVPPLKGGVGGDPLNFPNIFFYKKLPNNHIHKVNN